MPPTRHGLGPERMPLPDGCKLEVCPHCGTAGIFVGVRTYYSRGWPAKCRECGGLAYDRPHGVFVALGCIPELWIVPLSMGIFAAGLAYPRTTSVAILASIPALVVYWWWHRHDSPVARFRSISAQSSRRSRWMSYGMLVLVIVLVLWLLFGGHHARTS
jgi:hypothetical protein